MDNENTVGFEPAARAELLAMFTGMALQGILSNPSHATLGKATIASEAVDAADSAVDALEKFHQDAAASRPGAVSLRPTSWAPPPHVEDDRSSAQ